MKLDEFLARLSENERLFAASRLAKLENGSNQHQAKIEGLSKERPSSKTVITLEKAAKLMDPDGVRSPTDGQPVLRVRD